MFYYLIYLATIKDDCQATKRTKYVEQITSKGGKLETNPIMTHLTAWYT